MRKLALAVCVFIITVGCAWPKSRIQEDPAHGTVSGTVYKNEYFGLTWAFPAGWTLKETQPAPPGAHYYVLLDLLPSGMEGGEEVSLSAQNLIDADHFWAHYLDSVKSTLVEKGWKQVGARHEFTIGDRGFDTDDYQSKDGSLYVGIMASPLRNHELKFFVSAASLGRLEDLEKSISLAKFIPDWSAPNRVAVERFSGSRGPVTGGKLVNRVDPVYPAAAKAAGIQGTVVITGLIGKEGAIDELYVLQGHPMLIDGAIEAVSQWRYDPYKMAGTPVPVHTEIVVNFSIPRAK